MEVWTPPRAEATVPTPDLVLAHQRGVCSPQRRSGGKDAVPLLVDAPARTYRPQGAHPRQARLRGHAVWAVYADCRIAVIHPAAVDGVHIERVTQRAARPVRILLSSCAATDAPAVSATGTTIWRVLGLA